MVVSYWNSTSNHNCAGDQIHVCRVVSYWNSTSNHNIKVNMDFCPDVVSYWNSTSNHNWRRLQTLQPDVVSYWNSTSNHNWPRRSPLCSGVVSYWNSTSNHNNARRDWKYQQVVSYWNSTSNHNLNYNLTQIWKLYLIEILHQTTTVDVVIPCEFMLYLIEILHQTTTVDVVIPCEFRLYLIEILHQTTTTGSVGRHRRRLYLIEILHQTTTSNHPLSSSVWLYLIEILHQTTTRDRSGSRHAWLYLIEILHQTTTSGLILAGNVLFAGCLPLQKTRLSTPVKSIWCIFRISKNEDNELSEKFQLLRRFRLGTFAFAPEVQYIPVLFVRHRQNTRKSSRRHRSLNPLDVDLHILLRSTMTHIDWILHHREAVLLQRFAELCRMASFGLGIGRQIEKDKQPHNPIGIQTYFRHSTTPIRDMRFFSGFRQSIWPGTKPKT